MHLHSVCVSLHFVVKVICFCLLCSVHCVGKLTTVINDYDEYEKSSKPDGLSSKNQNGENFLPPPPPLIKNTLDSKDRQDPVIARAEEDDIFVGDGVITEVPGKDMSQSPISEDMEESPRNKERTSYFDEPVYGPVPPSDPSQDWNQAVSLLGMVIYLGLVICDFMAIYLIAYSCARFLCLLFYCMAHLRMTMLLLYKLKL